MHYVWILFFIRFDQAVDVITLHHLVYPDHVTATEAKSSKLTGIQILRVSDQVIK